MLFRSYRLIKALLRAGGEEIGRNHEMVYVSFPVISGEQRELRAVQQGLAIYSARHPEEGGTTNGLYARWAEN